MKIGELTQLWGEDLSYGDYWLAGTSKPIYYDDNRIPLTFYYSDPEYKGNATGNEIITIISYSPQKGGGFDKIIDGIPSLVTYSQLKELGLDGILFDGDHPFLSENGETARLTVEYTSSIVLSFSWFNNNDPGTQPAELIEIILK